MFRRREKRSFLKLCWEVILSIKGLYRAIEYIKIRIKRIPDTPHKISLGVSCGIFASFTPFFGLHFVIAGLLSYLIRGNVLASLIGTFVGNPITFPFITLFNLKLGELLVGKGESTKYEAREIFEGFLDVIFLFYKKFFTEGSFVENSSPKATDFIYTVFLPYSLGGVILGIMSSIISYFLLRSLVDSYQKRKKKRKKIRQERRLWRKKFETR